MIDKVNKKINTDTIIIGAGPTGLSLAYHLKENVKILEKEGQVGGLCREIKHGDAVFDIGGHSFHTPYQEVFDLVNDILDDGLYAQKREAFVYTNDRLIHYPFQKNYDQIHDPKIVSECKKGLANAIGNANAAINFEDYIIRKFGKGIADHFMLPYNKKLWARDIKQISCEWTSERIADIKNKEEKFDLTSGQRKPLQADTKVSYPQKGSFAEIFKSFIPFLPGLELNKDVVNIDPKEKTVTTSDGASYSWNKLFSTIPIPVLTKILAGTPIEIQALADELQFMSLRVELFLIRKKLNPKIQRIYVADPEIPPHKIALNNNSSEYLKQKPYHTIISEVSYSKEKNMDMNDVSPKTISFLSKMNILESSNDIIWNGHVDVKYAYPVYTHNRPKIVQEIKKYLQKYNIHTAGRFGDWEYINSDKCIWKGMNLAKNINDISVK